MLPIELTHILQIELFYQADTLFLTANEALKIRHLVMQMENETTQHDRDMESMGYFYSLLTILLITLHRNARQNGRIGNTIDIECITINNKFISLVEKNYKKHISVSKYAELLGISQNRLEKNIKELYHSTPSDFIQQRLVTETKRMLLSTKMSQKEISAELGFEDCSYFAKFFKRNVGCLPSEYRIKASKE